MGRIAYVAYKDWIGLDLPEYEELPLQERRSWDAAADAVRAVELRILLETAGQDPRRN
jgi:hypothetical protein